MRTGKPKSWSDEEVNLLRRLGFRQNLIKSAGCEDDRAGKRFIRPGVAAVTHQPEEPIGQ